ncbi:MAG: PAS domain S-box protein [Armatimonadetes bacterium]|nr:PAS domain S-box protein [Armatimonadota bacterium]
MAEESGTAPLDASPSGHNLPTALEASEASYRDLVEHLGSIILRLDPQGRITFINRFGADFLGYPPAQLLGRRLLGTLVPAAESGGRDLQARVAQVLDSPETCVACESEGVTRDGRRVWVTWTIRAVRDRHGRVEELLCAGTDMTSRRPEEQQRLMYEAALNSSISAIGLADLDGTITYVNPAYLQLYGLTSTEQVVGTNMRDYFESTERAQMVREALLTHGRWTGEGVALRPDGGRVPMEVRAQVVRDAEGRPLCMMASFSDITERRRAEDELAAEKERLAVTLRSIGDGVIATDIHGNVTLVNRAAELLTGWTQEEALGKPASKVFHLLDREGRTPRTHPVYEVLVTGRTTRTRDDGTLVSRQGAGLLVQDTASPIFDANDEIIGVVLVFRDITEQEQLRDEAYRTHKLESLGILAGGIAHDFNNLLTGLLGQLAVTRRRLDPLSRAHQELEEAERVAFQARHLTHQLLTFASGGTPIKKVLSVPALVRDMVELAASGQRVVCELDLPEDLAAIEADEGQIAQVINNLVLNSVQAMPEGGKLTVTGRNVQIGSGSALPLEPGAYVQLTFSDEGPGIPPQVLPRVFDPYFTTRPEGNGLGLTIAYSIVKKHGGHIVAQSPAGQGAVMDVFLPATDRQPTPKDEQAMVQGQQRTGRILVMDDDAMIRKVASTILRHLGYEVDLASDGEEAVAMYREAMAAGRCYALVILDLTVRGGLGGCEAMAQLRALDPEVRALACSGYSNDPVMANCAEHGFCGVVVKPYQTQELGEAVSRALGA